jgi:hypothetical protein
MTALEAALVLLQEVSWTRHVLPLIAPVSVWWGASAWNSIAAKQVVLHDPSAVPLMAIMSNVPGGVVWCFLWLYDRTILHQSLPQKIRDRSLCKLHGLVGANVSLVQAVKAIEPLFAMAHDYITRCCCALTLMRESKGKTSPFLS